MRTQALPVVRCNRWRLRSATFFSAMLGRVCVTRLFVPLAVAESEFAIKNRIVMWTRISYAASMATQMALSENPISAGLTANTDAGAADAYWTAVSQRDASFDGVIYYAVRS